MVLFICHASEDQPDFVRPLAEELRKQYEKVWYSEYELALGDSLLKKIDEGLASCDFGIVVLSRSFFEKKWPRAELDGLFARETASRKIILPIWKGVTEEEVKEFSPILAGKMAISTTEGLPKVLEAIRVAISVTDRQRKFNVVEAVTQRVQTFRQSMADKREAERLLASEEGAAIVSKGVETLWQTIQNLLSAGEGESDPVKFVFSKGSLDFMNVRTVRGMYLQVRARNVYSNAMNALLEARILRRNFGELGEPIEGGADFYDSEFRPTFRPPKELVWADREKSLSYGTEELAAFLVDLFLQHVSEVMNAGA
jgi:TIR domain